MIIIHVMNDITLPRYLTSALQQRMAAMPVVVLSGARQTGKSTLAQELLDQDRRWFTLDDFETREALRRDPGLVLEGEQPVTIDEVQRLPDLLFQIKQAIDKNRSRGRFLLTGSANLLLMRQMSESLAGRAAYLSLHPMTRGEQAGQASCGSWGELVSSPSDTWLEILETAGRERADWKELALHGGFPTPAVHMTDANQRSIWFDGYESTYLERDLLQLSYISNLPDFRRLMRIACHRLGQILNQTDFGRDSGLPQPTVHRYLNLLEVSHLLVRLPAYAVNRTKRLIKSPKVFWGDTGLALHLSGNSEPTGSHLENLVFTDLRVWADASTETCEIHYWRTVTGEEVDFVVETSKGLLPVEVKASGRVGLSDVKAMRIFRQEYPEESLPGLLLYDGMETFWIAPDVLAVPWWGVF